MPKDADNHSNAEQQQALRPNNSIHLHSQQQQRRQTPGQPPPVVGSRTHHHQQQLPLRSLSASTLSTLPDQQRPPPSASLTSPPTMSQQTSVMPNLRPSRHVNTNLADGQTNNHSTHTDNSSQREASPSPTRRRSKSTSIITSLIRPVYLWVLLLLLICVYSGYRVGQFLLTPSSSSTPTAAPDTFIHNFPATLHTDNLIITPSGGEASIIDTTNTYKAIHANPAIISNDINNNNQNKGIPQLLLLSPNTPSTHPAMNTLPLTPTPTVELLPYTMSAAEVPPPFSLSGPTRSHNEERSDIIAAKQAVVHLPAMITSITSPLGHKVLSIYVNEEGQVGYSLDSGESAVLHRAFMATTVNYKPCAFAIHDKQRGVSINWQILRGSSYYRPVPGAERRYSYTEYNAIHIYCVNEGCGPYCPVYAEFRVYEEGLAIRAYAKPTADDAKNIMADPNVEGDEKMYAHVMNSLQLSFSPDFILQCWANSQEEPYVKKECAAMLEPTMTPITLQLFNNPKLTSSPAYALEQRFISILQADGPAFMRSFGGTVSNYPNMLEIVTKGEAHVLPKSGMLGTIQHDRLGVITPTAWHVILIGNSPGELIEHNYLIPLLCPPPLPQLPNMIDTRWIGYGKSIRGRGFDLSTAQDNTHALMDWAATHNYQIVHFDAGWYGNEYSKTESATHVYHPFQRNLNMTRIGQYAQSLGIKFSVYVNELALRETDQLIQIYADWGIHAVKFGFVNTLSPRAMRVLHERIIAFGSKNLFVNVHDLYRPKGLTRTWPHLVTQEGIRGEERKPSAEHHTILPFVRLLQGSADYTPRYLKGSGILCSRAHQLALPIVLFSPIQSLFWAEPAQAILEGVRWYYPELILWTVLPTVWDDTRVLAGEIGGFISIARRVGQEWFIASISNTEPTTLHINLTSLFMDVPGHPRPLLPPPSKGYIVHVYGDAYSAKINTATSGRNAIKVLPRMTFLLPAQFSSAYEQTAPIANLPADTAETIAHVKSLAQQRKTMWELNDKQMREDHKHFLQAESDWQVMQSGALAIEMAPSGGHVVYIRPNL